MKTIVHLLLITVILFGVQSCEAQQATVDVKNAFLVDVRTPAEFAAGSVPGAVNIPLGEVQQRLAEFNGKKQIVVFCRSGNRSSQAYSILKQNGFTNVVDGGTWQQVNEQVAKQTGK